MLICTLCLKNCWVFELFQTYALYQGPWRKYDVNEPQIGPFNCDCESLCSIFAATKMASRKSAKVLLLFGVGFRRGERFFAPTAITEE